MFYNKNGIIVDETRYKVQGETFPINTMASVCAYKITNYWAALVGLLLALAGLSLIADGQGYGFILIILGAPIIFLGLIAKYAVRITNASGNADSYMSTNREEILEIVDAINEAIIKRG